MDFNNLLNMLHWILYYGGFLGVCLFFGMYFLRILSLTIQRTPTVADRLPPARILIAGQWLSASLIAISLILRS